LLKRIAGFWVNCPFLLFSFSVCGEHPVAKPPQVLAWKRWQQAVKKSTMKITFILFLFFLSTIGFAQQSETKMKSEIIQLHDKTHRIHDSIYLIISDYNRQTKTVTDPILKEALRLKTDSLWDVSDRNDI
jgi:hypothetical protein